MAFVEQPNVFSRLVHVLLLGTRIVHGVDRHTVDGPVIRQRRFVAVSRVVPVPD